MNTRPQASPHLLAGFKDITQVLLPRWAGFRTAEMLPPMYWRIQKHDHNLSHHVLVRFRSTAKALPPMYGIQKTNMTELSPPSSGGM